MNYFEQIILASEENILSLLGHKNGELDSTTKMAIFKRNVEIVNLELSYQCNRRCDYCPVAQSTRKYTQRLMGYDLLSKIGRELETIRYENRISLNLYNEPLLDVTFEEKVQIIRKHLKFAHIQFNTNGDKLTSDRLKKLSNAGCDSICVTLHPPANKVQSRQTINHRIVKLLRELTGTTINDFTNIIDNDNSIQTRAEGVNVEIQWPNWRSQGSNRAGTVVNHISMSYQRTSPCAKPFREFTIYYDGSVQPCCEVFHDDTSNLFEIGNCHKTSIYDLYTSHKLSRFRRELFSFGPKGGICQHCNIIDYSKPSEAALRDRILMMAG